MAIQTRLTKLFNLEWPIISAPMAGASGGNLAAEVQNGGGLGLIGGGYGDATFINQAWQDAGNSPVGIGFITWTLEKQPELLDAALEHGPPVVMLSFGNPRPFGDKIRAANASLMCQCQTISHVYDAIDAGAAIIVVQGSEAGGHGAKRGTLPFVPEVADLLAKENPDILLIAAGGIGDGRSLAACLMLGADGALIGTRYWATKEALVPAQFKQRAMAANGDNTIRTSLPDIARNLSWPEGFDIRILVNKLVEDYHPKIGQMSDIERNELSKKYMDALTSGNADDGGIIVGEIMGIIDDIPGADTLTRTIGSQAQQLLTGGTNWVR